MAKFRDLTGITIGKITCISVSEFKGNGKKPATYWNCVCDCGKEFITSANSIVTGHTKSCGCLWTKHGLTRRKDKNKNRLYSCWSNMRRRCKDETNKRYENYGGKGVSVCDEWDSDYKAFHDWAMLNGYSESLSIDRIDVTGNYCPENCRFVNAKRQANNTTRNVFITYEGETKTLSGWADAIGVSYSTMAHRWQRGWDLEKMFTQKQRIHHPKGE